ncbi:MAG: tetratricopeptide repeat protein [Verrucomicrobiota bacterium]
MSGQSNLETPGNQDSPAGSFPLTGQDGKLVPPEAGPRQRGLSVTVCLLLALAVWIVFGQTHRHAFVNYDDDLYVYQNPVVEQGVTLDGIGWAFTHSVAENWHPLTIMSYMLDAGFYGVNPGGYHLTNVLLHTAAVILLFLVLKEMTGALWPSAFVAAVFAIHPLRVESVAWIAERKDVLSGVFFMLTLWAYVRYVQRPAVPASASTLHPDIRCRGSRYYWLAVVFFALGLMSKPMLVTLPFILLLLDYWPLDHLAPTSHVGVQSFRTSPRQPMSGLLVEKIPFFVLSAATCVIAVLTQEQAATAIQGLTFASRIGNALMAYAAYLGQMIYPAGLAVFYAHPGNQPSVCKVGLAVLVLLIISAGVLAGRRRHPYLLVGWLWYLGMLVPVIGLMQVGIQGRADRYTYLPQIGLYILVAWGAVELCGAWRYRWALLGSTAGVILAGLLMAAYVQTGYWKDGVTLWRHTLACTPENYWTQYSLGIALVYQGQLDEAIPHYERALQLKPDFADACVNLGNVLARQGKWGEAVQDYERALQLKPDYAKAEYNLGNALTGQGQLAEAVQHYERALQLTPHYAEAEINLGNALAALGKPAEAVEHYERGLRLAPDQAGIEVNFGNALASQGKLFEAVPHYERALQLDPGFAEAHYFLGNALAGQRNMTDAIGHFERAVQLKPDYAEAQCNLGLAQASLGRWPEAIQQLERAVQLKPDFAAAHLNLGAALAHEGKMAEAIAHFQRAADLATAQGNAMLAQAARQRLQALQQGLTPSPPR